jgi:hypothetical protein
MTFYANNILKLVTRINLQHHNNVPKVVADPKYACPKFLNYGIVPLSKEELHRALNS